jgi:hypothetical protein
MATATLTRSETQDTRTPEQVFIDKVGDLSEKDRKASFISQENKVDIFQTLIKTVETVYQIPDTVWQCGQVSGGFLFADTTVAANNPNRFPTFFVNIFTSKTIKKLDVINSISLTVSGKIFLGTNQINVPAAGTDFSLPIYLLLCRPLNNNVPPTVNTDYQPLLAIPVGNVNYSNSSNAITPLSFTVSIDLNNLTGDKAFTPACTQLTQAEYDLLTNYTGQISAFIGYDFLALNSTLRTFMNDVFLVNSTQYAVTWTGKQNI